MAELRLALRKELAKPKYGLAPLKRPMGSEPYIKWDETPDSEPYGEMASVVNADNYSGDLGDIGAAYNSFTWRAGSDNPKLNPPVVVKVPDAEYEEMISELALKGLIRKSLPVVYVNEHNNNPPFHSEKFGQWLDVPTIVRFLLVLKYARPNSRPETEPYLAGFDGRVQAGLSALPTLLGEPRHDLPYPTRPLPASVAFSFPRICTGEYMQLCHDDTAETLIRLNLSPYLWIDDYISDTEGWPVDL